MTRLPALLRLLVLLCASTHLAAFGAAATAVDAIGITVGDLARAQQFYSTVLDFEPGREYELAGAAYDRLYGIPGVRVAVARMHLGAETIELMQFVVPPGRAVPADTRSNDRWFQHIAIIVSDMAQAYAKLQAHHVEAASRGPQRLPDWNPNAGGIEAYYFRDPDGNHLEILHFPPGKGDTRWQDADGRMFLGIDHSAIVVADTGQALRYYRDTLGMTVAGASENYGIEQERLNNVDGAHLRITALRAPHGPGIEFLHYLAPAGGRAMPGDTRANDLWHWQIVLSVDELDALAARLREAGYTSTSSAVVTLPDRVTGYGRARLFRDPDGHAALLTHP